MTHVDATAHSGGEVAATTTDVPSSGCDAIDDLELIVRFESLAIVGADFRHREHVRLAYAMLDGADFGEAAVRYRRALHRFAIAAGVPSNYHETLTWAYLGLVHERMRERPSTDSRDFLGRNADLLDHTDGALARVYDVAAITASPLARSVFVLPVRR